jgi:hypothetical protein
MSLISYQMLKIDCECRLHENSSSLPSSPSTKNLIEMERSSLETSSKRKNVSFCGFVVVNFIPEVSEYKAAGVFHDIWHSDAEMNRFQVSLGLELSNFMAKYSCTDRKTAYKKLIEEGGAEVSPCPTRIVTL